MDNAMGREIKRAAEAVSATRMDVYLVKRWQAALVLSAAALMLVGLVLQMMGGSGAIETAGYCAVFGGVAVVLVTYIVLRRKGPLNYTVYYCREKGAEALTLTVYSRRRFIIEFQDITIEYDRGNIVRRGKETARLEWDWFVRADFSDRTETSKGLRYTGECDEKRAVLNLVKGYPDYAEFGGVRVRYLSVNALRGVVMIPDKYFSAAVTAGIPLEKFSFIKRANQ